MRNGKTMRKSHKDDARMTKKNMQMVKNNKKMKVKKKAKK
jgi:hypothetical protein